MEKKSKILILVFSALVAASIIFSAYRFLMLKNYIIDESQVPGDAEVENNSTDDISATNVIETD